MTIKALGQVVLDKKIVHAFSIYAFAIHVGLYMGQFLTTGA